MPPVTTPKAIDYYLRFVAIDDRAQRVFYKLALAHYRSGHPSAALEPVRKAIALDRQFTEAYYLLGLCERETKRFDEAAAAFTRALSVNPAFSPAREELATLDSARGRRRDSIEQLEALAALEPGPGRLIDVAEAYARAGRLDSAVLTLARAADQYPAAASVYVSLARFWLDVAEEQADAIAASKASNAVEAAAARDPQVPGLPLLRGRAELLRGHLAAAERSFQAATTTLPVQPSAFRYLADTAERLGHRDAAQLARARYVALAP